MSVLIFFGKLYPISFVLGVIALLAGTVICWKYRFKSGIYFFLIMFISYVFTFSFEVISRSLLDDPNLRMPEWITVGELVAFSTFFPTILAAIAFIILTVGLYRKLKPKNP